MARPVFFVFVVAAAAAAAAADYDDDDVAFVVIIIIIIINTIRHWKYSKCNYGFFSCRQCLNTSRDTVSVCCSRFACYILWLYFKCYLKSLILSMSRRVPWPQWQFSSLFYTQNCDVFQILLLALIIIILWKLGLLLPRVLFVDAPQQKKTTYCEDCIENRRFATYQLASEGKMSIRTRAKESGILSSRLKKRLKQRPIHAPKL